MLKLGPTFFSILLFGCSIRQISHQTLDVEISNDDRSKVIIDALEPVGTEDYQRVNSLTLTPAMYNSVVYIDAIRALEDSNVHISIVEGYGISAIIAALYASGAAHTSIEWKIFKLLKTIKSHEAFSREWRAKVSAFLSNEFGNLKLTQLGKLLLIPKIESGKIVYELNQTVKGAIEESLFSRKRSSLFINSNYQRKSHHQLFGADQVFSVNALDNKFKVLHYSKDYFSYYSKVASERVEKASTVSRQILINLNSDENIDEVLPRSLSRKNAYQALKNKINNMDEN